MPKRAGGFFGRLGRSVKRLAGKAIRSPFVRKIAKEVAQKGKEALLAKYHSSSIPQGIKDIIPIGAAGISGGSLVRKLHKKAGRRIPHHFRKTHGRGKKRRGKGLIFPTGSGTKKRMRGKAHYRRHYKRR